ncbi:prostate and testis expressed protein 1 [Thomomys bottae]
MIKACNSNRSLESEGEVGPFMAVPSSLTSISPFAAQEMDVIQCRMCHLMFPGEKCSRGRGVCTATNEEACAIGMMYKADHTLWLTFMGCVKNCANVRNIKWSVYFVTFKCCRGYDLCNEDL